MKKKWLFYAALVLCMAISAAPKFWGLPYLEQTLAEQLRLQLGAKEVQVRLKAPWGWELFLGRIPQLEAVIEEATLEGLLVDRLVAKGNQIRFDPRSLFLGGELIYQGAGDLRMELLVTEKSLNEFFWAEVDPEQSMQLILQPQAVVLEGAMNVWNMQLALQLTGDLQVWGDSVLRFVPSSLAVKETTVPPFLLEMLNDSYGLGLDFGVFPYPIVISDLQLQEGQMLISIGVVE